MTTLIGIFIGYYLFTLIFMYGLHNTKVVSLILLILFCWIEFPIFLSYTLFKFRSYVDDMSDVCDAINEILEQRKKENNSDK